MRPRRRQQVSVATQTAGLLQDTWSIATCCVSDCVPTRRRGEWTKEAATSAAGIATTSFSFGALRTKDIPSRHVFTQPSGQSMLDLHRCRHEDPVTCLRPRSRPAVQRQIGATRGGTATPATDTPDAALQHSARGLVCGATTTTNVLVIATVA